MKVAGKRVWLGIAVALVLCGCQHDPYADWFVTKAVQEKTLVGSYHVTEGSLEHFAQLKLSFVQGRLLPLSRDAKIVLASNHSISVSQVPIEWSDFDRGSGARFCVLNSVGTWKLGKLQEFTTVDVGFDHLKSSGKGCPEGDFGFHLDLFDDSLLPFHIAKKYPLLNLTIGDPDSGDAVQFERD